MEASILIVHFGDYKPVYKCIKSIYKSGINKNSTEIIIIDNNLHDNHKKKFKWDFPNITYIKSKKNNFCHALNLGLKKCKSDYFVLLNPDTLVQKNWLAQLLEPMNKNNVAAVTSKVIFRKTRRINSLGIEELPDFYYRDIEFNEEDDPHLKTRTIKFASGCSVAYKKSALEEVGGFDEDFVMYVEDVDMGIKLRANGYKLLMNPKSVVLHEFHGTAKGADLADYFCNRNRFLILAKHYPEKFAAQIEKSHYFINGDHDNLILFIKTGIYKLFKSHPKSTLNKVLPKIMEKLTKFFPIQIVKNIIKELELYQNLRKPTVGIYDHALHFIGGGQKYGCTIAEALQKEYDVTFVINKPVKIKDLEKWYNVKLDKCSIKKITLPINKKDEKINPTIAESADDNPFKEIGIDSNNYDIFINENMVPHVQPMSLASIFVCHFPDGEKKKFFYVDNYSKKITNSKYSTQWMKKRWGIKSDDIIYPPIDMFAKKTVKKENIILSISRFEESGSKKQLEMAKIFKRLCKKHPHIKKDWKLILAGGSITNNPYLKQLEKQLKTNSCNIEVHTNLKNAEIRKLYASAKIFWHACGFNVKENDDPRLIEHFGMTTVEAMQNKCAPIVINGGGQREIVEHKIDGYRFNTENELLKYTSKLIKNENLLKKIQKAAFKKSKSFSKEKFQKKIKKTVDDLTKKLQKQKYLIPEAHDIYKKLTSS